MGASVVAAAAILFALVLSHSSSALKGFGPCPDRDVKQDFQMNQFLGLWYELQRYKITFEQSLNCVQTTFTPLLEQKVNIRNTGLTKVNIATTISGVGWAPMSDSPAKLFWIVNGAPPTVYWILDTDYYNYAVVWSCADQGFQHEEMTWVFGRDKILSDEAQAAVTDIIQHNKIDPWLFMNTTQTKCNN